MTGGNQSKGPERIEDNETRETLAAIQRGIADADAGRATPSEEVRRKLPSWALNHLETGE